MEAVRFLNPDSYALTKEFWYEERGAIYYSNPCSHCEANLPHNHCSHHGEDDHEEPPPKYARLISKNTFSMDVGMLLLNVALQCSTVMSNM